MAKKHRTKRPHRKAHHSAKGASGRQLSLCPCSGGCCRAAGVKCKCRCHGRAHGVNTVRANPPGSTKTVLKVRSFNGRPAALEYVRNGHKYRHEIHTGARILIPHVGDFVIIKGVRASQFLEG